MYALSWWGKQLLLLVSPIGPHDLGRFIANRINNDEIYLKKKIYLFIILQVNYKIINILLL